MRVVVRVRPLESNAGKSVVCCDKNTKTVTVQKPNSTANEPPKVYQFDSVFGEDSTQVSLDKLLIFIAELFVVALQSLWELDRRKRRKEKTITLSQLRFLFPKVILVCL